MVQVFVEREVLRTIFGALDAAMERGNTMGMDATDTSVASILRFTDSTIERLPPTQVEEAVRLWREGMEVARG